MTQGATGQQAGRGADERRERILRAAFATFLERGYSGASTLEIARRAKVSKRELYALFRSKQGLIAELVTRRSQEMRRPLNLTPARDRAGLAATLIAFGAGFLEQLALPSTIAINRLAIAEAERAPELARTLNEAGREAIRDAMVAFIREAQTAKLVAAGDADAMAGRLFALLIGDLPMQLLLGLATPPAPQAIAEHAKATIELWLMLYGTAGAAPAIGDVRLFL